MLFRSLGAAAVDQFARGVSGVLVGVRGGDVITTPLADIAGKTKGVNQELLELARVLAQ